LEIRNSVFEIRNFNVAELSRNSNFEHRISNFEVKSREPLHPWQIIDMALAPDKLKENLGNLVDAWYPHYFDLFRHYNQNPELGLACHQTAKRQAEELRRAGCEAHENVGSTGVVGVLKNGDGPTLLYRADMDALPIPDLRPEPWRCTDGQTGHQCGHSLHSAMLPFVARALYELRDRWSGTALLVAQDGEEGFDGANVMLREGRLYERFGRPDAALAYHVSPTLPAGTVGLVRGPAMSLAQFADIEIFGVGGHGGNPHTTIDPIVLAAHLILRFQTIVAREIAPLEPAVISVGSIQGGDKHSIIPEYVRLQLTIRTFSEPVFRQIMAAIERVCRAEALASGLPDDKFPVIRQRAFLTQPLINDEALTARLEAVFTDALGAANVRREPPYTVSEDFSSYGLGGAIPISLVWLGSVDPAAFDAEGRAKRFLPPLHHPEFNPAPGPTMRTGVLGMTAALLELFGS
jgi:amidohydrolase